MQANAPVAEGSGQTSNDEAQFHHQRSSETRVKKGDPVVFNDNGRRVTGTVIRVEPRASIIRLDEDGKEYKIRNDRLEPIDDSK